MNKLKQYVWVLFLLHHLIRDRLIINLRELRYTDLSHRSREEGNQEVEEEEEEVEQGGGGGGGRRRRRRRWRRRRTKF